MTNPVCYLFLRAGFQLEALRRGDQDERMGEHGTNQILSSHDLPIPAGSGVSNNKSHPGHLAPNLLYIGIYRALTP
jgi:hypothetical protein